MSDEWETDEPEFYVLDPCGQVLDSFPSLAEAKDYASTQDDAVGIEERRQRRRMVWSLFDDVFDE